MIIVYEKSTHTNSRFKIGLHTVVNATVIIETDGDSFEVVKNRFGRSEGIQPIEELPATVAHFTILWQRGKAGMDISDDYYLGGFHDNTTI